MLVVYKDLAANNLILQVLPFGAAPSSRCVGRTSINGCLRLAHPLTLPSSHNLWPQQRAIPNHAPFLVGSSHTRAYSCP